MTPPISPWVARWLPQAQRPGAVLDLACGRGRHSRFAHTLGFDVVALDRDPEALQLVDVARVVVIDLETSNDPAQCAQSLRAELDRSAQVARRFSAIVVTNYLYRPLLPGLLSLLANGGLLIYETFAAGQEKFGRPRRPEFLLNDGELLQLANAENLVVAYENGLLVDSQPARVQRLCLQRRSGSANLEVQALQL